MIVGGYYKIASYNTNKMATFKISSALSDQIADRVACEIIDGIVHDPQTSAVLSGFGRARRKEGLPPTRDAQEFRSRFTDWLARDLSDLD